MEQYASEATQGPYICDVAYPSNAPGFILDPTGAMAKSLSKEVWFRRHFLLAQACWIYTLTSTRRSGKT